MLSALGGRLYVGTLNGCVCSLLHTFAGVTAHLDPHRIAHFNKQVYNGNGVLIESGSPAVVFNGPACFQTQLYSDLRCSCWGKAMAACPADAPWFCRRCVSQRHLCCVMLRRLLRPSAAVRCNSLQLQPTPSTAPTLTHADTLTHTLRSCVKDWKRVRGSPGVTMSTVSHFIDWSSCF